MNEQQQVITVSQFVAILNETLSFAFPEVVVEGEVSGFKVSQGKWVTFSLKDDDNMLSCFMVVHQLKVPVEDGMKIRVAATPRLNGKFGRFSLNVKRVELAGEGEIRRAYELLRRKLEAEGLFNTVRKRPLPKYPRRIGLITSEQSAAYADFIKILNARWQGVTVELAHVQVQGVPAPDQICRAFDYFNQLAEPVDVVVLIRGGGSLEDLQAFSTEQVARSVAGSRTPTVVGVGHEVDVSLADLAADLRAATPTDAARLVVPDRTEERRRVLELGGNVERGLATAIDGRRIQVDRLVSRLEIYLRHPRDRVTELATKLHRGGLRLDSQRSHSYQAVTNLAERLRQRQEVVRTERQRRLQALERVLSSLSPQATLARGYAIVRQGKQVVRRAAEVPSGSDIVVQLAEGQLNAKTQ